MSAPNTTPGPWVVNPFCAQVNCAVESKIGGLLPVCQMLWPTDERSEVETLANAALVAAAPELYEALEELARLMDDIVEGNYKPDSFTTQPAHHALFQARGEQS